MRSRNLRGLKGEADEALRGLIKQVRVDQPTDATVSDLIEAWLGQRQHEASTVKAYRSYIRTRIGPAFGNMRVDKVTPQLLDSWYRCWEKEMSPASVKHANAILSGAFNQAIKWGWVSTNPTLRTTLPKQSTLRRKSIPPTSLPRSSTPP
ncbi:MAG: phage integrase central domain-containing protein [bacterium]